MKTFKEIVDAALDLLTARQRGGYAAGVISGWQHWNSAGLKSKAKRFGSSYAKQRAIALEALHRVGGVIIPTEHGFLCTAAPRGQDDYGNAIVETRRGMARLHSAGNQFHHL